MHFEMDLKFKIEIYAKSVAGVYLFLCEEMILIN